MSSCILAFGILQLHTAFALAFAFAFAVAFAVAFAFAFAFAVTFAFAFAGCMLHVACWHGCESHMFYKNIFAVLGLCATGYHCCGKGVTTNDFSELRRLSLGLRHPPRRRAASTATNLGQNCSTTQRTKIHI